MGKYNKKIKNKQIIYKNNKIHKKIKKNKILVNFR